MAHVTAVQVRAAVRSHARSARVGRLGLVCAALLGAGSASRPAAAAITFVEEAKVTAADAGIEDRFGVKVAIDGDTLVVGASFNDHAGAESGAAYVFVRNGDGTWVQQAKLTASDAAAGDAFGQAVAISGDTVVVGAADKGEGFLVLSGAAYVFTRAGSAWTQQAKLTASDPHFGDQFGWAAALDGDTLVVAAIGYGDPALQAGAAYVFVRSGETWTEQAKLTASDAEADDALGLGGVDLSGDTIVAGAPREDENGTDAGAAYVFVRSGGSWAQQAKLTASDGAAGQRFGTVALDADTALIGAAGTHPGTAYVFTRSGAAWSQQARLTLAGESSSFGAALDLSGGTAVISNFHTAVHVFARQGGVWTEQTRLVPSDGMTEFFGFAVAVDGTSVAVGSLVDDQAGTNAGAVYLYRLLADDDSDDDGIPDDSDPDTVADVVGSLDPGVFSSAGHPTAIRSRLDEVEAMILAGDTEAAIHQLENLLRRVDGCPATPTAGESADTNDWITDCDAQRIVRQAIIALIEALRTP
jgi:hypothetical protein